MLKLRTFEGQAQLSVLTSALGLLAALAGWFAIGRRFHPDGFTIDYGSRSLFMPALGATLLLALVGGAAGFLLGLNTAGQRRNKTPRVSWLGFGLGAAAVALGLSAGVFFALARNPLA